MNDEQFKVICQKLDRIYAGIALNSVDNKDDKIFALKQFGYGYKEIGPLVSMKDVRKTEGWKRK